MEHRCTQKHKQRQEVESKNGGYLLSKNNRMDQPYSTVQSSTVQYSKWYTVH